MGAIEILREALNAAVKRRFDQVLERRFWVGLAVGVRSYYARLGGMPATEKISVAMGREELRLAKTAAREAGVSLSAFVTEAVRDRLTEKRRREAASEVLAMFDPEDLPTPDRERELLELWSTPTVASAPTMRSARPPRTSRSGRVKPSSPVKRR